MLFTSELLVAALAGVAMAGPTHLHRHRDVHAKRETYDVDWASLDWDNMGINWSSAYAAGQAAKATSTSTAPSSTSTSVTASATASPIVAVAEAKVSSASTTLAKVASTSSTSAAAATSTSNSIISDLVTLFSDIEGLANKLTTFGTSTADSASGSEVSYVGNIGTPEGSNMILVDSIDDYDFTAMFENTSGATATYVIWNKAAKTSAGVIEANLGSCIALTTPALSFTLASGGKQAVAFQSDSQIGWAEATSKKTASGAPDTTWGEANFVSTGSGYDVSSIVNSAGNTYDMSITSVEAPQCTSDITQNDWIAGPGGSEDPVAVGNSDGSCYVSGSTMTLTVKMGGDIA